MRLEHLGDLVADPHDGVQGRHGLLKHHGDPAAPQGAPAALVEGEEILLLEQDLTAGGLEGGGQQAGERIGAHRLAGARFTDDAEDLARHQVEGQILDRVRAVGAPGQGQGQVPDPDDGLAHAQASFDAARRATTAGPVSARSQYRPAISIRASREGGPRRCSSGPCWRQAG